MLSKNEIADLPGVWQVTYEFEDFSPLEDLCTFCGVSVNSFWPQKHWVGMRGVEPPAARLCGVSSRVNHTGGDLELRIPSTLQKFGEKILNSRVQVLIHKKTQTDNLTQKNEYSVSPKRTNKMKATNETSQMATTFHIFAQDLPRRNITSRCSDSSANRI